jgi:hypothetical protein
VIETSAGNFQAWLKHSRVFPKLLGSFAAQTLAERYDADPSAADWRRFGRLPGFTNCKPKYRKPDGFFPFVRLHSYTGQQYPMAQAFEQEIAHDSSHAKPGQQLGIKLDRGAALNAEIYRPQPSQVELLETGHEIQSTDDFKFPETSEEVTSDVAESEDGAG